jgi:hypothetical protein
MDIALFTDLLHLLGLFGEALLGGSADFSFVAVEDPGDLLQGRTFGFNVA